MATDMIFPALRLFDEPIVDRSVERLQYERVLPRDPNFDNKNINIDTENVDQLIWLHRAVLEVRGRVVKNDGTNYDAADNVALANGGWSLFETVQIQVNNKTVEEISQYASTVNTIMRLVTDSDDSSRSTATSAFWYRDTGATSGAVSNKHVNRTNAQLLPAANVGNGVALNGGNFRANFNLNLNVTENPNFNIAFASCRQLCASAKDVTLMPPFADILGFAKDIDSAFIGIKFNLNLTRASAENSLHRANGVDAGKFQIKHLSLWVPFIRPSIEVQTMIESKLVAGYTRMLYFEQGRIYRERFTRGQTTVSLRVTTNGSEELPTHIFVAFQDAERSDNQEQTIHVFDNANLRQIHVRINNNHKYPEEELEVNYTAAERNYSRAYMMFQDAAMKYSDPDTGSQVNLGDFANLFPIYHFDVSHHPEALNKAPENIDVRWILGGPFNSAINAGGEQAYHVYCFVLS